MNTIVLKNMAFYGYHGNLKTEQLQGQRFFVDLEIQVDASKAGRTDCLEDSINYVDIYEVVKQVMTGTPYHLLERLGAVIADRVCETFGVDSIRVAIRKPSVPIAGLLDYVEVVTTRGKYE